LYLVDPIASRKRLILGHTPKINQIGKSTSPAAGMGSLLDEN